MKIICTQENLKGGVAAVTRIISPSNTLPILNNILLKTENGLLKISSTNLEVAISVEIRCKIEEEGGITVFSKAFTDLVNNLPNKNISLESKNNELFIETENYHTSLKTLPAEEFPLIPEIENADTFSLDALILKESIDQVVFAVSTNQTQPEISGVMLSINNGTVKLVATDRYRLAEKQINIENTPYSHQVIIPHKTLAEVARLIGGQKGMVDISLNETQIAFVIGQTKIVSRLIDGQYPPYQEIVPKVFNTTITLGKTPLVTALKTSGIFSQGSNSIRFIFSADKGALIITSESQDLGKSEVELPCHIEGQPGELILNYHYVLDGLSGMDSGNILLKVINDSSPSIIVPEAKTDYMYLVMPIKS